MKVHRRVRFPHLLVVAALLQGCTMAMLAQMSGPKKATKPKHVAWPEAQALADQAAAEWVGDARLLGVYLTLRGWERGFNEGNGAATRSTPLWLFLQRKGGALVKGDHGDEGAVCFQHACAVVQDKIDLVTWSAPYLDCDEQQQVKVTCESVRAFTDPPPRPRASVPAPPAPGPAPGPAPRTTVPPAATPAATYLGEVVVTTRVGGKLRQDRGKLDLRLVDHGDGRAEITFGTCRVEARRVGSTITIASGQRCDGRDARGTLVVRGPSTLDVALRSKPAKGPAIEVRGTLTRSSSR